MATNDRPGDLNGGKVGSDPDAARQIGGDLDFGIPARSNVAREVSVNDVEGTGKIMGRPAGSAMGRTGASGTRETGVSSNEGGPGHGSGGDVDPDFVGVAGAGGISQSAPGEVTEGPQSTDGSTDDFSGRPPESTAEAVVEPARGRNALPKNSVGGDKQVHGHTHGTGDVHNERQGAAENFYDPQDTK
jgi:hypothetical protein